jgi:hypothetical protein
MKSKKERIEKPLKLNKAGLIAAFVMLALSILALILKNNEYIAEYIFSRGISRGWQYVIGHIPSIYPFSVFELLSAIGALYVIIFFINLRRRLIKRKKLKLLNGFITMAVVLTTIFLSYTLTASVNYNRETLPLVTYEGEIDSADITAAAEYFRADLNAIADSLPRDSSGSIECPYTVRELAKIMREEVERLIGGDKYYNSFIPLGKPITCSTIMSWNRISGIFFGPTVEANINKNMPCVSWPSTMAHELAHSLGLMREEDANLFAAYITLNAENDFIRYSGYMDTIDSVSTLIWLTQGSEVYFDFLESYSNSFIEDELNIYDYWSNFVSPLDAISNYINDLYLKLQGSEEGTGSYQEPYEYEAGETGETTEYGEPLYEITEYSPVLKVYFAIYYASNN